MPSADPVVLETLPSEVAGVRRLLLRGDRGGVVEALELPPGRAEQVPQGGIFAAFAFDGTRILLGPPLARRLSELRPSPLAVLGVALRLLEDLETLHRVGGVHGGIAADGVGVDELGCLRVRPALHLARDLSPQGDVAALGAVVLGLVKPEALEAAGVKHARSWLSGVGAGGRVGFPDARAARQALSAATRGLDAQGAATTFLEASGVKIPAVARELRVRPVPTSAPEPGPAAASSSSRAIAARVADARRWIDEAASAVQEERFVRESRIDQQVAALSRELHERTDRAVEAARALSTAEAEHLVRATPTRAMLFVHEGHHRQAALPTAEPPEIQENEASEADSAAIEAPEAESVDDERSVDSAMGMKVGVPGGDALVESVHRSETADVPEVQPPGARGAGEEEAGAAVEDAVAAEARAAERVVAEEAARVAAEERALEEARAAERVAAEEAARVAGEERAAEVRQAEEEAARIAAAERAAAERAAEERVAAERATAEAARIAAEERAQAARIAEEERAAAESQAQAARVAEEERLAADARAQAEAARIAEDERAAAGAPAAGETVPPSPLPLAGEGGRRPGEGSARSKAAHDDAEKPDPAEQFPDDDPDSRPGIARWEGAVGVTGDASRMHEKGPGKWTLQGRSMEDLAEQLPPGEARALDMSTERRAPVPWAWVAGGAVALGGLAWLAWG